MPARYRNTFTPAEGVIFHCISADYIPALGADELITDDVPATDEQIDARWPAAAAARLDARKAALKEFVDGTAERLRLTMITPGSGQAAEYAETQAQAFQALAAPDKATAAGYPMLAASIGIDFDPQTKAPAVDVLGVARAVDAAYLAWMTAGAAIRAARLKGKAAIEGATTADAAQAAFDAIVWPSLA